MTTREEAAAGFQTLTEILKNAGLRLRNSSRPWQDRTVTFLEFGTDDLSMDIVLSDEILSDLPSSRESRAEAEAFAAIIAARIKCGSPNAFYCRSGIPIDLKIHWPINTAFNHEQRLVSWLMVAATNELAGTSAMCALQFGAFEYPTPSPFQRAEQIANRMRDAIDEGSVHFTPYGARSSSGQLIEQKAATERRQASEEEIERFLVGKAYDLGFRAAHSPRLVWIRDPWDASYLGTTTRTLSQAAHILQARKLLVVADDHARPSDKLLSEGPLEKREERKKKARPSLSNIPLKDQFNSELSTLVEQQREFSLILIDLDNFKAVNDTGGHPAGDVCLERVVRAICDAVGQKGNLYRWGGDEFAVCLEDFSTDEAAVTAERIRRSIEDAKPGGTILVTASIGVCATDNLDPQSPEEAFNAADRAMYSSKHSGKNRVTVWPVPLDLARLS